MQKRALQHLPIAAADPSGVTECVCNLPGSPAAVQINQPSTSQVFTPQTQTWFEGPTLEAGLALGGVNTGGKTARDRGETRALLGLQGNEPLGSSLFLFLLL